MIYKSLSDPDELDDLEKAILAGMSDTVQGGINAPIYSAKAIARRVRAKYPNLTLTGGAHV